MKKLYFLDEEEKNRILNIHESATKKQYLGEANEKGGAGYVDPATDTPDAKIAREFYVSASGPGTNEANMLAAIQGIKSPVQFWKVNELVKNLPGNSGKLDIAGVINDEMGRDNLADVNNIIAALKTAGITATKESETRKLASGGTIESFKENTFKITSQPIATGNVLSPTFTDTAMACIKQFSNGIKNSTTPGYAFTPLTDGSNLFFMTNYGVKYQNKDKSMINGKWSCKGNILNIVLTDGSTWSKAQGGWKGSGNQTAVVDSKKTPVVDRNKVYRQQLATRLKQTQKSIGVPDSGTLDVATLQAILNKLNASVTSSPTTAAPTTAAPGTLTPEELTSINQTVANAAANINRPQ